jgi:hypothetical protein
MAGVDSRCRVPVHSSTESIPTISTRGVLSGHSGLVLGQLSSECALGASDPRSPNTRDLEAPGVETPEDGHIGSIPDGNTVSFVLRREALSRRVVADMELQSRHCYLYPPRRPGCARKRRESRSHQCVPPR